MSRFLNPQPSSTSVSGSTPATSSSSTFLPLGMNWAVFNVPVKFSDLGKDCKDLLSKDFPYDVKKVEVNTVTPNKVAFTVTGSQNNNTGVSSAEMKIKYVYNPYGVVMIQKWSIDNLLTTEIEAKDTFAKGLTHKIETSFSAAPCTKATAAAAAATQCSNTVKLSADYVRRYVHLDTTLDVLKGPTVTAAVVAGRQGFFVGGEATVNGQSGNVDRYNFASAFYGNDYQLVFAVRNKISEYAASYFHAVNPNLSTGCTAVYNSAKGNQVHFEFASAVKLSPISAAKVKMDSHGHLTLAYAQELAQGIKGTISALVNTRCVEKDAAKVGFQLNFNA